MDCSFDVINAKIMIYWTENTGITESIINIIFFLFNGHSYNMYL